MLYSSPHRTLHAALRCHRAARSHMHKQLAHMTVPPSAAINCCDLFVTVLERAL
jgi:hypothetical protein